ncbi:hypothetical protein [Subtercola endophyticus]|uniref:hypothetical protein n=1 Tax=Subtercola endophyticus TaxID=2895559 RepID=UPI001E48D946|nr:hypothetical protein [Subtercola endophyticus]UFS57878.1 hypothetical protein LQ955_12625 [Subtercola endophyticus]
MENHSTSDIDIETTEAPKKGLTRRQVATGAAWAVPVVALAVSTPLAAASVVIDSPTAYLTGTISATGTSASPRTATYVNGSMTYNSAGVAGQNSGNLTLTVYNNKPTIWSTTISTAAYISAGWALVSANTVTQVYIFSHTAVTNGVVVTMPTVTWNAPVGSTKPVLGITLDSDSDDVSALGLSLS